VLQKYIDILTPFLQQGAVLQESEGLPNAPIKNPDENLRANAYYFGQTKWMMEWLEFVHSYPQLRERWHAVSGRWDDKVVVDIGCGPGSLFKTLGGRPALLIGIDVAPGSLRLASELGYVPLLADAHDLPLKSGFADIVAMNATVHHVTDMSKVLLEGARLVKNGGVLVVDHDPQLSAYDLRGFGLTAWKLRKPIYRWMNRGGHRAEGNEQEWVERTEVHHRPGAGVTEQLFRKPLEAIGFDVSMYPHNIAVGTEIKAGERGRAANTLRWAQRLSGIDPDSKEAALILMCVARKRR
jgi:SAM-dependent methyltransferase